MRDTLSKEAESETFNTNSEMINLVRKRANDFSNTKGGELGDILWTFVDCVDCVDDAKMKDLDGLRSPECERSLPLLRLKYNGTLQK